MTEEQLELFIKDYHSRKLYGYLKDWYNLETNQVYGIIHGLQSGKSNQQILEVIPQITNDMKSFNIKNLYANRLSDS